MCCHPDTSPRRPVFDDRKTRQQRHRHHPACSAAAGNPAPEPGARFGSGGRLSTASDAPGGNTTHPTRRTAQRCRPARPDRSPLPHLCVERRLDYRGSLVSASVPLCSSHGASSPIAICNDPLGPLWRRRRQRQFKPAEGRFPAFLAGAFSPIRSMLSLLCRPKASSCGETGQGCRIRRRRGSAWRQGRSWKGTDPTEEA